MDMYEQKKYDFVHNGKIPFLNMAGVVPEVVEKNHVRFRLPVEPTHMNHVGIVYAGSYFVVGESAGATLIWSCYAESGKTYTPIIAGVTIDYKKPCKTDLIVDMRMSEEEAAEKIKPIDERGRGRYPLDVPVCDTEGNECAVLHMTYYLYAGAAKL